jgi:predicted ArsR family transcriptional regulator
MAAILTAMRVLSGDGPGPVTVEAIADKVGLPGKTVRYHLVSMERLGLVSRQQRAGARQEGWGRVDFQMP